MTQATPENWIWWATSFACGFFMGRVAEFLIAKLGQKKRVGKTKYAGDKPLPFGKWAKR